jgi:enamine deaminase RidA (YjgF/YER057c/UK114 family)
LAPNSPTWRSIRSSAFRPSQELNDWWRRQFPDLATAPARFTFQAAALPFGAKIEIQAVAAH